MVKRLRKIQQVMALALALTLAMPIATLAGSDGKKHFKQGMQFEDNRQWDKAAEQFALALAEKPSNVEYQLHLQKSLVNAGAMLVERGDKLAEQKDYNAAYQAYRQGYSFDPTNEMSLIKARRMLEKQGLPTTDLPTGHDPSGPKLTPDDDMTRKAAFMKAGMSSAVGVYYNSHNIPVQLPSVPGKRFAKTDVVYRDTPLLSAIEQLAQTMKLNVIFDQQVVNMMRAQKLNIELRDVTYPRAMEMILKTNNLMYAQMDTRTIVVASDNPQSRLKYEPFSVRTFYIKNAEIQDVRGAIQSSLNTKSVTPVKQLNALIVRDTPANLELIESMINSMDKAKAEVLIDINIYEVSRNDLLQIGNQFNTSDANSKAGTFEAFGGLGSGGLATGFAHTLIANGPWGFTAGVPPSLLSLFQDKGKSKLLASTQVHVLDDQDQSIKIGQRVPIQTAFVPTYSTVVTTGKNGQPTTDPTAAGFNNFGFGGSGYPQIQYENVGLNIDMKPNVFEDEVQLKMKIDSSSIDSSINPLTPTFNQRTMSSMARIRDGQTTLIAGVTQSDQSKRVKGLPLIGLIPILGRFFATPQTTDRQSDVVITVTPHILRRADIRDEDHYAKYSGDGQNPYNQLKIEQILYLADQNENDQPPVAAAQSPPQPAPQVASPPPPVVQTQAPATGVVVGPIPTQSPANRPDIRRVPVSAPGAQNKKSTDEDEDDDDDDESPQQKSDASQPVIVSVRAATPVATRGQDLYVAVNLVGNSEISAAHISLSYDPNLLEPKSVRDSGLLRGGGGAPPDLQFTGENGLLNIELDKPQGSGGTVPRGQLCLIIFTVKNAGTSPLTLNDGQCFLRTPSGQTLPLRIQSSQVETK